MQTTHLDAFDKSKTLVGAILVKINGMNKSRKKFLTDILILFMGIRGRYNFMNMSRYGNYSEQTYRNNFEQKFDFIGFNSNLIKQQCSSNRLNVFDPTYIPKSGKHTDHLGNFWSGTSSKALKGLEIGVLAVIDIDNNTAMSLEAIQTQSVKELKAQGKTLVDYYAGIIIERKDMLKELSPYLAVDGYFAKHGFVKSVTKEAELKIISKLRSDANLYYLYEGKQKKGRGRPRQYEGKIAVKEINKERLKLIQEQEDCMIYSGIVWSKTLKRKIKIAYVEHCEKGKQTGGYAILFTTDLNLEGTLIYQYYKSRFQIEFLFRDAKQFCGLTHCQARGENKLHFHFNASLTSVSIAKAIYYLSLPLHERDTFSMQDIKTFCGNKIIIDRIFENLGLNLTLTKLKNIYEDALSFGSIYKMVA